MENESKVLHNAIMIVADRYAGNIGVIESVAREALSHEIKVLLEHIEELETLCGEAYQVIGVLSDDCGRFQDQEVQDVLDNLGDQKLIHKDVLPFPSKETS